VAWSSCFLWWRASGTGSSHIYHTKQQVLTEWDPVLRIRISSDPYFAGSRYETSLVEMDPDTDPTYYPSILRFILLNSCDSSKIQSQTVWKYDVRAKPFD
jgi:hypothetical protein